MKYVLDASVALKWVITEADSPNAATAYFPFPSSSATSFWIAASLPPLLTASRRSFIAASLGQAEPLAVQTQKCGGYPRSTGGP
jgi:hypothetical protein